ncbi:MAG: hypothetical protein QOF76_371 [Solirubrobacteraceae bacterium]|nr:hypothetical protein [Solirubrobacteraceae bacterium]
MHTTRAGAAAKAGHDLTIEVGTWEATVADGKVRLTADPHSLRVIDGSGGIKPLDDDDKRNIEQTIRDEILPPDPITYADGALTLNGHTNPVAVAGNRATVRQSDFGLKPYSALFGTLKVADEVTVEARTRE